MAGSTPSGARKAALLAFFREQGGANLRDAARRLGVHRATVYRWAAADPAFAAQLQAVAQQAAQQRQQANQSRFDARRAQRLAELRPQRQQQAAHARSCKRRAEYDVASDRLTPHARGVPSVWNIGQVL